MALTNFFLTSCLIFRRAPFLIQDCAGDIFVFLVPVVILKLGTLQLLVRSVSLIIPQ